MSEPEEMTEAERQEALTAMAGLKVCPECGALAMQASPPWDVRWGPTPGWSHYSINDMLTPLCPTFRSGVCVEPVGFLEFYGLPQPEPAVDGDEGVISH